MKTAIRKYLNYPFIASLINLNKVGRYLPIKLAEKVVAEFFEHGDIIISNVPGPKEPCTIKGKRISNLSAFANLQHSVSMFIVPQTFNGKFRLSIIAKENLKLDVGQFMSIFMKNLQDDVDAVCK